MKVRTVMRARFWPMQFRMPSEKGKKRFVRCPALLLLLLELRCAVSSAAPDSDGLHGAHQPMCAAACGCSQGLTKQIMHGNDHHQQMVWDSMLGKPHGKHRLVYKSQQPALSILVRIK